MQRAWVQKKDALVRDARKKRYTKTITTINKQKVLEDAK
jgi:hypothetical protein